MTSYLLYFIGDISDDVDKYLRSHTFGVGSGAPLRWKKYDDGGYRTTSVYRAEVVRHITHLMIRSVEREANVRLQFMLTRVIGGGVFGGPVR